jgi:uncharacterized protein
MQFFRTIRMGIVRLILVTAAVIYLCAMSGMYVLQRHLQYFPTHAAPTPEMVGLSGVQVVALGTPDGETVALWYTQAKAGYPTILFFHGNAGEVGDRASRFAFYQQRGFGVAFLSYRGFGGSTGDISETGLMIDAQAAYDRLVAQGIPADRIVLVGESLGTGVAVQLAARHAVGAVVLDAPYAAAVDVAAGIYPWLPVRLLMKDQFRSIDHIGDITAPLLILHGTRDAVIPFVQGQKLFAAANMPKQFAELTGAGHQALFDPATWAREVAFLSRVFPP